MFIACRRRLVPHFLPRGAGGRRLPWRDAVAQVNSDALSGRLAQRPSADCIADAVGARLKSVPSPSGPARGDFNKLENLE